MAVGGKSRGKGKSPWNPGHLLGATGRTTPANPLLRKPHHPPGIPGVRAPAFGLGGGGPTLVVSGILHLKPIVTSIFLRLLFIEPLQCTGDASQTQFSTPSVLLGNKPLPHFTELFRLTA